jgi:DNA-binding HxlR family transcriptional regulator
MPNPGAGVPALAAPDPAHAGVHALDCSIASTLQVIGDRWTLLVLRDAFRGVRRFDDFAADLGIARNLLADRLGRLVEHGILAKVPYQERPVRHEYRLTAKGRDLSPALVAFMHWGDKHLAADEPPVVLVHDACGEPLDQVFVCWRCDETLTPRQIRSRPGAGHVRPVDTDAPDAPASARRHVHL